MSSRSRACVVALVVSACGIAAAGRAQGPLEAGAGRARLPFVSFFREHYHGAFELTSVGHGRLRASSDVDPRPRSAEVALLRMQAMTEGCTRLSAVTADGRVQSIAIRVLARDSAVAVPRSAAASERVRVSVGDEVIWPLPDATDATFLPPGACDDDDPDMRTLLAGEYPGRTCALEGGEPRAWRLPGSLEPLALRCHFASRGRGEVTTTVERVARIRRAGRVQGDLSALAPGSPRSLVATHVVESERGAARPLRIIAYVPTRRVVRAGDWVFERRGDVEALDEDLLACLHERDSTCRVRPRVAPR